MRRHRLQVREREGRVQSSRDHPGITPWTMRALLLARPSALSTRARGCAAVAVQRSTRESERGALAEQSSEPASELLGVASDADDTVRRTLSIGRGAAVRRECLRVDVLNFGGGALWVMCGVASREIYLVRCVVVCAAVVERERERECAVCRCECRCAAHPLL